MENFINFFSNFGFKCIFAKEFFAFANPSSLDLNLNSAKIFLISDLYINKPKQN